MTLEEIINDYSTYAYDEYGYDISAEKEDLKQAILSWFKEQLPSVDELRQAMESKWITMENSYSPRFKEYAETVRALILTNLEGEA